MTTNTTRRATVTRETANDIIQTVRRMRAEDKDAHAFYYGTYGLSVSIMTTVYPSERKETVAIMEICGVNVQAWGVYDADIECGELFLYTRHGAPMTIPVKGVTE